MTYSILKYTKFVVKFYWRGQDEGRIAMLVGDHEHHDQSEIGKLKRSLGHQFDSTQ